VDLSAAQDVEAGDGTTSVVVLAGSLLTAAEQLLDKGTTLFSFLLFEKLSKVIKSRSKNTLIHSNKTGIHPTTIAESFQRAAAKAVEFLTDISVKLDLKDRESLLKSASTSLNSKVMNPLFGLGSLPLC
jgi:T-complex protein 1 subunit delta